MHQLDLLSILPSIFLQRNPIWSVPSERGNTNTIKIFLDIKPFYVEVNWFRCKKFKKICKSVSNVIKIKIFKENVLTL